MDLSEAPPGLALHTMCADVARDLIARYQWSLLSTDDLACRTLAVITAPCPRPEIERIARSQYARALYAACRQDGDPQLRERAYADLRHYLYCAAYQRRPDLAEDLTHETIQMVIEQIGRVREPAAFHAFALFKLRDVLGRQPQGDPPASLADLDPADPTAGADELAEGRERAAALLAAIGRLPGEEQRQVLLLKYFGGLHDEQIGARLQVTANNVRVVRHRAMLQLRNDIQLRAVIFSSDSPLDP